MYNDNLKNCLIKLVNNLRNNKENNRKNVTILLGAGCSLSSSRKNITTASIIKNLVTRYSDVNEDIPKEWTKLYEQFVNNVWMGQGNIDRIQLLEEYFKDMSPSIGYQQIRFLIENNYVNNIITTNFDPMLDEVLTGLSYHLQVGTQKKTIGTNPQFTLLKAHGDLKMGQLRFAPSELYKLPNEIEETIRMLTDSILIIIGYRGQDMGIIQALNAEADHCAYWITYHQPDFYNDYENGAIINWLKKRNSERNILYGTEYGDFDTVFEKIISILQQDNLNYKNNLAKLWEKSYMYDYLRLNVRFKKIFNEMLYIIEDTLKDSSWSAKSFYYADSHDSLISSIVQVLNDKVFPNELLNSISNEINSLLFAITLEIWCCCQGYNVTSRKLIDILRQKYEENRENPSISNAFWEALDWLCEIPMQKELTPKKAYHEIIVSFDAGKSFEMVLKKISLMEFSTLFLILQRILLFVKTSGVGNDVIGVHHKKILEDHLYQLLAQEKDINVQLSQITQAEYQQISDNLLKMYFSEQTIGNRHVLHFRNLYVQVNVEKQYNEVSFGLMDELIQKSQKMRVDFLEGMQSEDVVWSKSYEVVHNFLKSNSNGLFISGDSGIGKTWFLKKFVAEISTSEYLIFPTAARKIERKSEFINFMFGTELTDYNKIKYIDMLAKTRHQKIIFIIDGINEIDANLQRILFIYKCILDFCDFLSKEALDNIRLIVTCRTEFCYHIRNSFNTLPSPSSFYSIVDNNGNASTIYQFPKLKDEDVKQILQHMLPKANFEIKLLKERFGDIIYVPLFLNMICKMISNKWDDQVSLNEYMLYKIWYVSIQSMAEVQQYSVNSIDTICNYIVYYKYFSQVDEALTTSELFIELSKTTPNGSEVVEWMIEYKIIKKTQIYQNLILFSHDKIEEFFLMRYIRFEYQNDILQAILNLTPKYFLTPIVQNSIYGLIDAMMLEEFNLFLNSVISAIVANNQVLISLIIRRLLEDGNRLYDILKYIEQFVCRVDLENFLHKMLKSIEMKIDNYEKFPISSMDNVKKYIQSSIVGNVPLFRALYNYNYAKYIWTFPIEEADFSYDTAITFCQKVNQIDTNVLPQRLLDKNNQLLALLLRNEGKLNEAAYLMNNVYDNLYQNAYFNEACQALLDLGAIYRELTWFDKALELYTNYPVEFVTDPHLENRLYMNTGIIYKNKVQNDLFDKNVTPDITYYNYAKSKELFEKVYIYARKTHHIPLLLEILAELVESTVAGYYLNLTTISEAVNYVEEMDAILPKYPIPVRRIQSCRMWARVLTLQGKTLEAIDKLRAGFQIAIQYNIPFRAADCCNQISGILCDNLNNESITREIIVEGIEACQYSINYYLQLQQNDHIYLSNTRKKMEILNQALQNFR